MRLIANENVPLSSVQLLREAGHDVLAVIEGMPGASDQEVLRKAAEEGRVLLTFDRDYGRLIYRERSLCPLGVVYFRFIPATPEEPAERFQSLIAVQGLRLTGRFTVVERGRARQRPLA